MAKTSIEWTRNTDGSQGKVWNPVRGCSKVSPGCKHCFAERMAARFCGEGQPYHGLIRDGKWSGEARFIPDMLAAPLRWKKPSTIFANSMSDLFHESLSFEQIAAAYGVIAACPQHSFQVLTKRAERMVEFYEWITRNAGDGIPFAGDKTIPTEWVGVHERERPTWNARSFAEPLLGFRLDITDKSNPRHAVPWPLPNLHLGVSVENQEAADERIPLLLQCPAAVRWISAEPLLGPIDFGRQCPDDCDGECGFTSPYRLLGTGPGPLIDWVVTGTESGPGRRPADIKWIESIVEQCKSASVPVFVKQIEIELPNGKTRVSKDPTECGGWPKHLNHRMMPGDKWK